MKPFLEQSSFIRAIFEEGQQLKEEFGEDNVFDFSLGNPSIPAPKEINQRLIEIIENTDSMALHGYMTNQGYPFVREAIAKDLNERFSTNFRKENLIMTVGAAGGLNCILKTLLDPEDEVIVFVPYFFEYQKYVKNFGGKIVECSTDESFKPNVGELEELITEKTKAVIINTPNNPTGVVYSEKDLERLAEVLEKAQEKYETNICLISDEPYRELVYGDAEHHFITKFYNNTVICYSYSKSLSLPGERIGYLVIPDELEDSEIITKACVMTVPMLGFVNAPSLMQRLIGSSTDLTTDVSAYDENRRALEKGLTEIGYDFIPSQGAFYLFLKSPLEKEEAFIELAKKYHILLVPGSAFGSPGYCRLAYCVSHETILRSLPKFEELYKEIENI